VTIDQTSGIDRRSIMLRGGLAAAGAVGLTAVGGALAAPAMAVGSTFNPVEPYRTLDTRVFGDPMPVDGGIDFEVWTDEGGTPRIPQSALAVTFNLTVTSTRGVGYLSVYPASVTQLAAVSHINWTVPNLDLANAGTTPIGTSSEFGTPASVFVACGGRSDAATHFIMDITGYFA
jgi:hypothetical protein